MCGRLFQTLSQDELIELSKNKNIKDLNNYKINYNNCPG